MAVTRPWRDGTGLAALHERMHTADAHRAHLERLHVIAIEALAFALPPAPAGLGLETWIISHNKPAHLLRRLEVKWSAQVAVAGVTWTVTKARALVRRVAEMARSAGGIVRGSPPEIDR